MSDAVTPPFVPPLPYTPSMEVIADDEVQTIDGLTESLLKISTTVHAHSGHAMRSVHAKAHGLLRGELQVLPDLPPDYAQGVFQPGARYAVVLRLSTPPGDVLPDDVSLPRGCALKLIGVDLARTLGAAGERLPGSEGDTTQDFVMADAPAFLAPDAKHFARSLKLLAATTDRAEGAKEALSTLLRGTERVLERLGLPSPTLKALGGHPMTHILGDSFHTQAALLHGPYMAKLSLVPLSESLQALIEHPLDLKDQPFGLRQAVKAYFAAQGGEWALRVQLCTDIETMPIEDPSVPWPESLGPHVTVATLRLPPQVAWDDEHSPAIDDALSFSPWHGIAAHRPIGSVMRARRHAYAASVAFRGRHNGCPMHEPRSAAFPEQ